MLRLASYSLVWHTFSTQAFYAIDYWMKIYFTIFALILSVKLFAQSDSLELEESDIGEIDIESILHPSSHDLIDWKLQQEKSDTLLVVASQLNGKWVLEGKYYQNKFLTDTISTRYSNNLTRYEILTDSGTYYTSSHNGIISFEKKSELNVIDFEFTNSTKGSFQDYDDYVPNREWQTITTCQPIPEIVFHANTFQILFTGMAGDNLQEFKIINNRKLVFIDENNTTTHYTKLTK